MAQEDLQLYDVAIIGAGPSGLAVASRLRESTPSALFTEVEHERYHFINKYKRRVKLVNTKGRANKMRALGESCCSTPNHQHSMVVLDSSADSWLGKWKCLFQTYGIDQLRSPMFFHVDPRDRDGLRGYAYAQKRQGELFALSGAVGKESSKHQMKKAREKQSKLLGKIQQGVLINQRDEVDYQTPSLSLFCDHCAEISESYGLSDVIEKLDVDSIKFQSTGSTDFPDVPHFIISGPGGVRHARVVILAVGPGSSPAMPRLLSQEEAEGACHTSAIPNTELPAPHVSLKIKVKAETCVLVIGGGLTSAQICDLLIRRGITSVYHIMRSHYKVKYFDVPLEWVSKYRNFEMASFWSADTDEERLEKILKARAGGSITPYFKSIEAKHVAQGRLHLHTSTQVATQSWNPDAKQWTITTDPPVGNLPKFDYIYYATGSKADVAELGMLDDIRAEWPIKTIDGMPCLTEDLEWSDDVPLFMNGRFAGLRTGPAAANLEGARIGAERIAWRVEELLGTHSCADEFVDKAGRKAGEMGRDRGECDDCGNEATAWESGWRAKHARNLRLGRTFDVLGDSVDE